MGDNTEFDLNDLPEEVVNEIVTGEVFTIGEESQAITEESSVVEEVVQAPKRAKKVQAKEEVVKQKKEPGMYHNGRRIEFVATRLGHRWAVFIDGKREKVLKSEIEIVK